ncbi:MAG TPA: hypothetical protein VLF65_10915 [Burkholderiales bacterium]|nr:hypothetical protein [Burkholderiales bacterium]
MRIEMNMRPGTPPILDVNLRKLRNDIENSRDFLFGKVLNKEKPHLFRPS